MTQKTDGGPTLEDAVVLIKAMIPHVQSAVEASEFAELLGGSIPQWVKDGRRTANEARAFVSYADAMIAARGE